MSFPGDAPGVPSQQLRSHHVSLPPLHYAGSSGLDLESQQFPHENHQQLQQQRLLAREQQQQHLQQQQLQQRMGALPQRTSYLPQQLQLQVPAQGFPFRAPPTSPSGGSPLSSPGTPQPYVLPPPHLRLVQSSAQLKPSVKIPKTRRVKPEGGFMSPLVALTTYLSSTYTICDPRFQYSQAKNPRRVLTEPHEAKSNNGFDNAENDYILYVNDILGGDENRRYLALNLLGKGTFGQVVKCQSMTTMEVVAVKVIKNKPAFLNQSMMEVTVLEHIQQNVDRHARHSLLQLKDRFMHKDHLCLVFELLSLNLYEVIKKNEFRGLGLHVVRVFSRQLLDSLALIKSAGLVHCDLKPENILLKRPDGLEIKVIDFGSACHERQTMYTYIQSRFYRSPEVILGLPYTSAIDMWSLGCIVAELFLGLPIFPGASEFNQWSRIVASLGLPPQWMLDSGKNTGNFMVKTPQGTWRMRTIDEQNAAFHTNEKDGRRYFASDNIHDTIMNYPLWNSKMSPAEIEEEMRERECLSDFVRGLINFNPLDRWTPQQAAMHPFISRQKFVGPYSPQPSVDLSQQQLAFAPAPRSQIPEAAPNQLGGGRYPVMASAKASGPVQPSGPAGGPAGGPAKAPPNLQPVPQVSMAQPAQKTGQFPLQGQQFPLQGPQQFQIPQIAFPQSATRNVRLSGPAYRNSMMQPQLSPQVSAQMSQINQMSDMNSRNPQNSQMSSQMNPQNSQMNRPMNSMNPQMNSMNTQMNSQMNPQMNLQTTPQLTPQLTPQMSAQVNPQMLSPGSQMPAMLAPPGANTLHGLVPAATGRGRSATVGQVNSMVPAPIQQAASRVDPNQIIQSHEQPSYFPPREYF